MRTITWAFILCSSSLCAQLDTLALRYARTITEQDLRVHLEELASDAYEGRETGRAGQKRAAEYLKRQFGSFGIRALPEHAGIDEGYFQRFDLIVDRPGGLSLDVGGREFAFMEDILYFSDHTEEDKVVDQIVCCSAVELGGLPPGTRAAIVLVPAGGRSDPGDPGLDDLERLAELANMKEMELLLVCTDRFDQAREMYGHWLGGERMRLAFEAEKDTPKGRTQVMIVSQGVGRRILEQGGLSFEKQWKRTVKGRKGRDRPLNREMRVIDRQQESTVQSENVLAFIEGGDLKEELVVVTAHYDHIGVKDGEVFNGADDDGSGTVALLELAQAFAMAKADGHGPRRSVLLMPVSGEEKGLLGSRYYSEHPVFPLENTVADLNIDMIGRFDSAHAEAEPYVYIIGSDRLSSELHAINQRANEMYVGLRLDETFNARSDPNRFYFRSDHYNFARKGVPVIFYFSGVHEDYHQPGDEVDKIRFDLLQKRTLLVFHTAWMLAGRDTRPVVDGRIEE